MKAHIESLKNGEVKKKEVKKEAKEVKKETKEVKKEGKKEINKKIN